ncbi:uncharacterized protein si:dkey-262k9.2 isoform X1 [Clarias gariepinus]|uniref:uncharacterized protein si:dkey-262k9.2 isoform X1 n=1 Tax=Clarias gariepinus TaxID=13013 RepID=UPI00234E1E16|nr:uncharacterized protein si:dkey-262k9.2 isoform X1 [Clarias gariepinus]
MRFPHLPVCRSCQNSEDIKTARKYLNCQFHKGFQKEKHTAIAHSSNLLKLNILIMTMLRLLLLTLLLTVKADKSDHEASGGEYDTDDEEQEDGQERITTFENSLLAAEVKNVPDDAETEDGHTMVIIIAAVCVVALAIVTVIAVVLFKLHLQRREQGVYSVPVEQGQKGV